MRRSILHLGQILESADAYYGRALASWPAVSDSGQAWEPADETWPISTVAYDVGLRGLRPGGIAGQIAR